MRRDDIQLEVSNVAWHEAGEEPRQPTLTILANGDAETIGHRFSRHGEEWPTGADVDVTFRFQGATEGEDEQGVLAISNRVTGEFLLETNATSADVIRFVAAARRYAEWTDGTARYRIRVRAGGESIVHFEKRTLLVYSDDGELLRQESLIPSGVEI